MLLLWSEGILAGRADQAVYFAGVEKHHTAPEHNHTTRFPMYPVRIISINKGWQFLNRQKSRELKSIQNTLSSITEETLDDQKFKLVIRGDRSRHLTDLSRIWDYFIRRRGWNAIRQTADGEGKIEQSYSLRNAKNGVTARMIVAESLNYSQLSASLLVDTPLAVRAGICEVSVLLIPTDELSEKYSDDETVFFNDHLNESKARAKAPAIFPLLSKTPIVIMFISLNEEATSIEEIEITEKNIIDKSIEFAPEYYQAGVGILSYFGEVLRKKHPDINAKVRIEQEGNRVRMQIETPTGDVEIVEKELSQYALVISEQASPESLYDNPIDVIALKSQLQISQLQVTQARDLLQLANDQNKDLKHEISNLRQLVGDQLSQTGELIKVVSQQVQSTERLQLAQLNHASTLFKDLLGEAHGNQAVMEAIRSLQHALLSGLSAIDMEDKVGAALATIKQQQPSMLGRIAGQLESAGYGALAGPVLEWISKHV